MSWIAAGTASAAATMSAVQYFNNKKQAKKDALNRPKYEIPAEYQQGLDEAKRQAAQGLPEAQQAQYRSDLQRGQAYSLFQNSSRRGGLEGVAALNENQNTGYANLLNLNGQAQYQRQGQLFNQLNSLGENKQQQFQINQENPYYEGMAIQQANNGAFAQNFSKAGQLGVYAASMNKSGKPPSGGASPYNVNGGGFYGGTFGKGEEDQGGFNTQGTAIG